jgi:hypothetical protein
VQSGPWKKIRKKNKKQKITASPGKMKWESLRMQLPAHVAAIIHQMLHATVFVSEFNRRLSPFDPFIRI